jgi:hypothetical protein
MEETSKSTTAFEGDDTDQKLPAEEKRSSKGSARENSERDAKRKAGRYGSVALNMAGERHHRERDLMGESREPLKLVDLLPPLLAPTVLLIVRVAKNVAVTKLQDLVHHDQKGMKRKQLEDNVKAKLPFLELTLLSHRLQDESMLKWLLVCNQIRQLMLPVLSAKKKRVRISQLSQFQ